MNNLLKRLNYATTTKSNLEESAVKFEHGVNTNYYESLCLYCADNDIDLTDVTDIEFEEAAQDIENRVRELGSISNSATYFWMHSK